MGKPTAAQAQEDQCQSLITHSVPREFAAFGHHFHHVHLDIIRRLFLKMSVLTSIDKEVQVESITEIFYTIRIYHFRAPSVMKTDQGSQFESPPFTALLKLLRCKLTRTTLFHPASSAEKVRDDIHR